VRSSAGRGRDAQESNDESACPLVHRLRARNGQVVHSPRRVTCVRVLSLPQARRVQGDRKMKRRAFLGGALSSVAVANSTAQSETVAAQTTVNQNLAQPLGWP